MTANGQPDNPRAARYILKDFMNGKLLYAHAPPGVNHIDYQIWPERVKLVSSKRVPTLRETLAVKVSGSNKILKTIEEKLIINFYKTIILVQ